MNPSPRTVGILAGMGPAAGVDFVRLFVGACEAWLREHAHTNGTWCHLYANVRPFPAPIPWKGAQGFWNFPDSSLPAGILGNGSAP